MARNSRKQALLDAALEQFAQHGYEGTSVGTLADEVGVSKAAVSYHFPAKDDLAAELAEPLLDALDAVVPGENANPSWPEGVQHLIERYLDVLLAYPDVATWLEGDRAVRLNAPIGRRLTHINHRMRRAMIGRPLDPRARVAAAVALGALWRPVRNVPLEDVSRNRDLMIESALAPLRVVR
ncbi:helix-turn-helix domain-containing protein [Euzebya pacifica]|uniref:TetR/AcrR family transcriptional regulator n=1 Tax=Euzebya pacifica TaxID=1608957 RepID=UPI0030F5D7A6